MSKQVIKYVVNHSISNIAYIYFYKVDYSITPYPDDNYYANITKSILDSTRIDNHELLKYEVGVDLLEGEISNISDTEIISPTSTKQTLVEKRLTKHYPELPLYTFSAIYFTSNSEVLSYIYWDFDVDITSSKFITFNYTITTSNEDNIVNIELDNLKDYYTHSVESIKANKHVYNTNLLKGHVDTRKIYHSNGDNITYNYDGNYISLNDTDDEFLPIFKPNNISKINYNSLSIDYHYGASYIDENNKVKYLSSEVTTDITVNDIPDNPYRAKLLEGHNIILFYPKAIRSESAYLNSSSDIGNFRLLAYQQGSNDYYYESRFENIKSNLSFIFVPEFIELTSVVILRDLSGNWYLASVLNEVNDLNNSTLGNVVNIDDVINICIGNDKILYSLDTILDSNSSDSLNQKLFNYIAYRNSYLDYTTYSNIAEYYMRLYCNICFNLDYILRNPGNKYDTEFIIHDLYIEVIKNGVHTITPITAVSGLYNRSKIINPDNLVMNNSIVNSTSMKSLDDSKEWTVESGYKIYGAKYGSIFIGR